MQLARGTLVGWVQQAAHVLVPVERQIKAALVRSPVLHHDETSVRRAGTLAGAHVQVTSTSRLTQYAQYAIHPKRGHEAMEAIGILPVYHGVSMHMHDGWDSYALYTTCRHALCTVHHLRELTFLEEQYAQAWASRPEGAAARDEDGHRSRTNHRAPPAGASAARRLPRPVSGALESRAGRQSPPPDQERRPGQRGRRKHTPARTLLERLLLQQDEVLGTWAFLDDLAILFDNTQAERDLRDRKVQHKVSGGFRSEWGAEAYATIRGYLATVRKQGQALLAAFHSVFAGQPFDPASAWPATTPVHTR